MILLANVVCGLISAAILFLGVRFWAAPQTAAGAFGIAGSPSFTPGFRAWLSVKGTRDIVAGLFVLLIMAQGSPRLLGQFMLLASLIAFGDMVSVLRSGGSRKAALGIHGATALLIVGTGAGLIFAAR